MAVQSPRVETLAQSMAGLDPAFKEQRGLINEQIEGLDAKYDIEKQALEGTRVQSFENINRSMVGRGAAFSGIGADEQSRYLANEYLPGLQRVDQAERDESLALRGQVAQLNMQQTTTAMSRIDQQQAALNQWNLQQAQMEAQRREAELDRQFQREQNQLDRSAAAAARGPAGPSASALNKAALDVLTAEGAQGEDEKVAPATFQRAMEDYLDAGGTPDDFRRAYSGYANLDWNASAYGYFEQ